VTISPLLAAPAATALEDLDRRHLVHPFQRGDITDRVVIVRGAGSTVWDSAGNELLDATGGGNWHSHVGHGRRELAEVAAKQIAELEYFTSFLEFSNDKAIALAARLASLAPGDLNKVFFTSGGSEGVDTAFKAARLFHGRRGAPDRTWFLARHYAYHGATYGSGTATGFPPMQMGVGPNLPHVEKLLPPYPYRSEFFGGADPTDFLVNELEQTIERIGAGNIAAMIGEPVMAGGGVLTPPDDYWPRIREVLTRNGILLIADEVVTAYGRTGAWFDSAQRGMDPDIITTAKGIASGYAALGAVLLRDEIADEVAGGQGFFHGYTFSGHPVSCAVALANLDIIERENLRTNALNIGDWFRAGLAPAAALPTVGDIRVEGAMAALEIVSDRATRTPMDWMLVEQVAFRVRKTHGVIVRPYGNMIVIAPPLVFTQQQAQQATAALVDVVSQLGTDGQLSST
jgi:adenosylmethionine-8-amino-7-oxononanoate aminotransferase